MRFPLGLSSLPRLFSLSRGAGRHTAQEGGSDIASASGTASRIVAGAAAGAAAGLVVAYGRKVAGTLTVGHGHSLKHRLLDVACAVLQRKRPLEAMSTYLNGFHMYADEMGRMVEATHFCVHLSHDLHQCVIFDRNAADARLIGVEYIISADRFKTLPEEEKQLWHSHSYEATSGLLVAPGVPQPAEHLYCRDLVSTYGKTFHTWQYDRDDFPYGIPQLMMGFTEDGQAADQPIADRDRRLGVSSPRKRRSRADIDKPDVLPGANPWESGRSVQTRLQQVDFKG